MTGFYASMMFIGILLIIVSLVLIFLDKWKSSETEKRIDQKREELAKIIADADLMVQELNKFSDYIISQVEQKNKETLDLIKNAEERLEKLTKEYASASMDSGNEKFVTNTEDSYAGGKSDLVIENLKFEEDAPVSAAKPYQIKLQGVKDEKVIPINSKHKEVLALAQKGLNETEIAKKLSMGKGEIQLILGVNK
ncbi:MAG TPA: hypothetical protein DEF39_04995 [Hungateiclostridium thermocellum]|jgi:ElaB/YqjD/DUF883 family membrane-anchored ribosome-binding protein|uniref:Uncharacterized protein n=2 Tax=Acetivibrio thermocellus TaxID=1515 RepID=A3DCQ8_ACET2|nr:hypothetical protein [Acetivibrio thermocellus]CDG35212.1 hypothetical protein CTHBC1_0546 [Acetivibrio thermocellus BC1]ABN51737.1 hypothetical protein Cthe_0500 [Acetivibrio thermocellus ATCC 27405]ADU74779.1 hypothetical protein Clo1313_1722 [Acetivibrio thermocellus DSM 1313]ALX08731.1 hypothetical protein AD2_01741 [Acetivibrio thermocellus AD2]ANV76483.1 hypothetical protein LQRI_1742 [Acetivibrio thermocellus DSM 2360]